MAEVLVDTDMFVDHLRGRRRLQIDAAAAFSAITRAELCAGRATQEPGVRTLLAPLQEIPVDRGVAELGGRVRRDSGVALPDALIAATAMLHGLSLLTRNRRHFERIAGLSLQSQA